ncbi:hypothetical protein HMI55_001178 [Coelomomyces lativittatus]|nr:hypothetical protein HMI55_001178 [Coelomomyces lativittatus]
MQKEASIHFSTMEAPLEIASVTSDTELLVKKAIVDEAIIESLAVWQPYTILPKLDHQSVYAQVFEHLRKGKCVGIFPEGGSHDRSELLPFKAGFCIMALGAKAKYPELDIKIVPVGLSYFHADRFRSRAVIEYGAPISIPEELVEWYKQGGKMKREACEKLLEWVHAAVSNVTVTAPDYNTLMVIQAVRRLYRPMNRKLTLVQKLALTRRLIKGYLKYKSDPRILELEKKVLHYNQLLKYYGLQDHQVERTAIYGFRALGLLLYRLGMLVLMGMIALPGTAINIPIAIAASHISKKKAKEALASSHVKIEARDVLATWKLLVALVLVPTLYSLYIFLSWLLVRFVLQLPNPWTWCVPLIIAFGLPYLSMVALKFGEVGADIYKSLPPLMYSILPTRWITSQNLRQTRFELAQDLNNIINELGPAMYPDFHQFFMHDTEVPKSHRFSSLSSNGLKKMSSWVTSWLTVSSSTPLDTLRSDRSSWTSQPVPTTSQSTGRLVHHTTATERRCFPDVQSAPSQSEIHAK